MLISKLLVIWWSVAVWSSQNESLTSWLEGKVVGKFCCWVSSLPHSDCSQLPNVRICSLSLVSVTKHIRLFARKPEPWPESCAAGFRDWELDQNDNRFALVWCFLFPRWPSGLPLPKQVCDVSTEWIQSEPAFFQKRIVIIKGQGWDF